MGRNLDSKCSKCRRAGEKLFLKGEKCFGPKCPIVRRNYPPGVHGPKFRGRKASFGFAKQLNEKQKVKKVYGLMERQFANYVEFARRKKGDAGVYLRQFLEMRLDNTVYRLGFAKSRTHARQIVNHGHIQVNGKNLNISSYQVRIGDIIAIHPNAVKLPAYVDLTAKLEKHNSPSWLSCDPSTFTGKVLGNPAMEDFDFAFDTKPVIEYYSR